MCRHGFGYNHVDFAGIISLLFAFFKIVSIVGHFTKKEYRVDLF